MAARSRPRPLADLVGPTLAPALARQGFTGHDLVSSWPEIVGERLAAVSLPVKVEWPKRRAGTPTTRPEPATLVVRVEGAFALDLQHGAPLVLERINAVYGWRCVGRLVLKQGPVGRAGRAAAAPTAEPDPKTRLKVGNAVAPVADPGLREALGRLGNAVATARSRLATSGPTS